MGFEDKEPFLARWSRRKLESTTESAAPAPAPQPGAAPATRAPAAKPELPPVDSLQGLASEYKDFLHPQVDEALRQTALKKLFRDPHFNVMDGLDVYIDDYSKPDPIPEAMLRTLEHAKGLLFDEEKKTAEAEPEKPGEKPDTAAAQPEEPAVAEAPVPPAPEEKAWSAIIPVRHSGRASRDPR
jgi:Protein of unknown function (DUF3306)